MIKRPTRFSSLLLPVLGAALVFAGRGSTDDQGQKPAAASQSSAWAAVPDILGRIKAPEFPDRDCPITSYGAVADGKTDATEAIRRAIQACSDQGGGRVVVPPGVFATGAIHLKSRINLHVSKGATLKFLTTPSSYPRVFTRWEGTECMNYSPLIYALDERDIAITGGGTLDGQASDADWWGWAQRGADGGVLQRADRNALVAMGERGVPVAERVFGQGHYLRPNFIQPYRCQNVLIEGVTIIRSPMWEIHPVLSTNVTVRGVTIESHGRNNDGCDPESCRDVLIEDSSFDTGDDCIAIKSGRNNDGRRIGVPSENIIVRRCRMKDGHGGVVIGSEISGGCRNVFAEECEMDSPNLDRALRIKSNAQRGGVVENIYMRRVKVGQVKEAVLTVDFLYEEGANGSHPPVLRNVEMDEVTSTASPRVFWIAGFPGATIDGILIKNSSFRGITASEVMQHARQIVFDNVTIEPARKGKSANSVPLPPTQ
jgi:unsaturated rhamnogalacturonyl hydrolase